MKIAHLVMLPALLFACYGTTNAQMPGYPMPGAAAYPGSPMNFADPMPMAPGGAQGGAPGGALGADMMANPMNGAPAYPEAVSGADGGFGGQDCYGSCGPGSVTAACRYGYIQMDALYWRREHGAGINIINASLDPNVNFINGKNLNYRFEALPRITGGLVLANGVAVEGTYLYKDDFSVRKPSSGTANNDNVAFGLPAAGSSFDAANDASVLASTSLQNGEINLVETERFFNFLAGFRWMEVGERTTIWTDGANGTGMLDLQTYNRLMGLQSGLRVAHSWGLFGLQAQGKGGLFYNDATGAMNFNDPGAAAAGATNTNGDNEAFVGEIEIMATIRTLSSWQYRLGYSALWVQEVALATDQIRGNAFTGAALNAKSDLFFHGVTAGAEFRW